MSDEFRGDRMYQAELDIHFPEITARRTLEFSASVTSPRNRPPGISKAEYAQQMGQIMRVFFNLSHAANTNVGNDLVRGVSGGEKRRISIAEAFTKNSPLQCYDNSTRGLDSATALGLVRLINLSARYLATTAAASIYQASQDVYDVRSY